MIAGGRLSAVPDEMRPLGAHTDAVLRELAAVTDRELGVLGAAGVIA